MKKIMFMIPNLKGGGAEKVLVDILNKIDVNKFDITLILLNNQCVHLEKLNKNIKVKILLPNNKFLLKIQKLIVLLFPKLYYKANIKEEYDVEIAFLEGMATKLISKSPSNSKKIAWVHIDLLKKHWTKKFFLFNEEAKCYDKFNKIIFVSQDALNSFNKVFENNIVDKKVILNPVIEEDITLMAQEKIEEFKDFTVVSVGRLNNQKGFDLLIKAHAKLVNKYKHKLVILGEGEERKNLEMQIKELGVENTVELKGFIRNPYPYIKAADIFVSSSRTEGYPLVLLEAVVLNKAIVATDVTGNREILNYGECGLMCECSSDDIANKLELFLKNEHLIKEYEKRSEKRKKEFDYKKVIREIEELF